MGKLEINVVPVDIDGESDIPDDMIPEDPNELIGNRIDFVVQITKAYDLPEDFCKDIYCEYTFFLGEEKFTSDAVTGKNRNPEFNFRHHHTIDPCTDYFLKYLQKDSLCVKLFGYPDFKQIEDKPAAKKQSSSKQAGLKSKKGFGKTMVESNDTSLDKTKSTQDSSFSSTGNSFEKPRNVAGGARIEQEFNVIGNKQASHTQQFLQQDNFKQSKQNAKQNHSYQDQQLQEQQQQRIAAAKGKSKKPKKEEDCTIF